MTGAIDAAVSLYNTSGCVSVDRYPPTSEENDAKRESRWTESIAIGSSPFIE